MAVVELGPGAECAQVLKQHWGVAENFDAEWDGRAELASGFLSGNEKWFCDLGCGPRPGIRRFLPQGAVYIGADMARWSDETRHCDLNRLELPEDAVLASDVCFMLGVLEYVFDVEAALQSLSKICETLVLSYCSTDLSDERWHLWVNAYSGAQIGSMLGLAGFSVERQISYKPGQYVMKATNRGFARENDRLNARRLMTEGAG